MATDELRPETEDSQHDDDGDLEHPGGGRFNRSLLWIFAGVAIAAGVVAGQGIRSSGVSRPGVEARKPGEDAGAAARDRGEVEDLAAHGGEPRVVAPSFAPPPAAFIPHPQTPIERRRRTPGRYAQWAEEKYLKALEAPQMVSAFHNGATLEIASAKGQGGAASGAIATGQATAPDENAITPHPPASPYTVMAGSVLPAVLVSGIDSDLPGPIVAQASQNVFDSATGKYLLIPQGSRLIGAYGSAAAYGQQRVRIAWRRLIFPNASSMDLPQMPGVDQGGYAGFTDEVNHHYLGTFGAAAVISLIGAG